MQYKHFTVAERETIQKMRWEKRSIRAIAERLGRSASSVSRELRKNIPHKNGHYTPRLAEARAVEYRSHRGRKDRLKNRTIRSYVAEKLREGYSPEQISGTLPLAHPGERISHEAIYQYVYAAVHRDGYGLVRPGHEDLRPYLKRRHKRRAKKGGRKGERVLRPRAISIELRPKVVGKRSRIGDWEGDSVVSKKSKAGLNTLVERKTGLLFMTKIENGTAEETRHATSRRLGALPRKARRTLTRDNGSENADWQELEADLPGLSCYAAHPYASCERGTNENTNGLIRWYFPKGTDFAMVTEQEIAAVEAALNNRPRKRLGWKTPLQAFREGVALRG